MQSSLAKIGAFKVWALLSRDDGIFRTEGGWLWLHLDCLEQLMLGLTCRQNTVVMPSSASLSTSSGVCSTGQGKPRKDVLVALRGTSGLKICHMRMRVHVHAHTHTSIRTCELACKQ